MENEIITEVETGLNPTDFIHFLKYVASKEVRELYFKTVPEFDYMKNPILGNLAFGTKEYQGHIFLKENGKGEEKNTRKMVIFFDYRSKYLPEEIKEDIREMIFRALNRMGRRDGKFVVSFTIPSGV